MRRRFGTLELADEAKYNRCPLMKIPFYTKRSDVQGLRDAIDRAADRSGRSVAEVLWITTFVWEEIANQVAAGRAVRIPSLGLFVAFLDERRFVLGKDPTAKCIPKFEPARAFRNQVALGAPFSRAGKRALTSFRQNHSAANHPERDDQLVVTAMEHIRKSIEKQMGGHDFAEPD